MSLFDTHEPSAEPFLPADRSIDRLREAAAGCHGCDLYRFATQTVFGTGPADARTVLVGEQPGDQEDRRGLPFVGPAGRVLRDALEDAGIDADAVYITNAVKHFKFVERGKTRIHQTPKITELRACEPWLREEIRAVAPELVVALGSTAAKVLLGSSFRVTQQRGTVHRSAYAERVIATVHPSSILRAVDDRQAQYDAFVADLRIVAAEMR